LLSVSFIRKLAEQQNNPKNPVNPVKKYNLGVLCGLAVQKTKTKRAISTPFFLFNRLYSICQYMKERPQLHLGRI